MSDCAVKSRPLYIRDISCWELRQMFVKSQTHLFNQSNASVAKRLLRWASLAIKCSKVLYSSGLSKKRALIFLTLLLISLWTTLNALLPNRSNITLAKIMLIKFLSRRQQTLAKHVDHAICRFKKLSCINAITSNMHVCVWACNHFLKCGLFLSHLCIIYATQQRKGKREKFSG